MSSIIEGYNYDIFISYRQKDNKGDRWVSEFVDSFKTELESTFKEEINVYFDINPHDGLLETHDVDASLKEKLKCLVFIPIVSRTYCDPKSFAWEHEFKAFVELAANDQFGLKIKLPGGNVANRVLPIQIHELDRADSKLCELVLGGVLRGIEFIYKEPGVNRPLTPKDNEEKNLNKTSYRNQINKVALAIKEIIAGFNGEPIEYGNEQEKVVSTAEKPQIQEKSIIVLPFENISPDPDQEYFSDGLTEEIITDLSHIRNLLVISRSSAMTLKGTKKTIPEIAQAVRVRYVLEGSVRKAGNNLRITAQLIDSITDAHLWAEKYNGTLDDVFDIQEKVSLSITDALKLKLSSEENQKISENKEYNLKVYECYLRAKQDLWKYTEDSLNRAEQNLINGLNFFGEHELLYSGLGQVYFNLYDTGIRHEEEILVKLKDCINNIFRLNPESDKGYHLSGLLKMKTENSHEAYKDLKKAHELNPTDPEIIFFYFYILCVHLGRISQAAPLAKKLLEIDPLTPFNQGFVGWFDIVAGDFDGALKKFRKWYDMEPDSLMPLWYIGLAMAFSKNIESENIFNFIDSACQKHPESDFLKFLMLLKYSLQKKREEFIGSFTKDIKQLAWSDYHLPWLVAECYALLEDKEQSLIWLEHSVEWGFINYPLFSEHDPFLENIRGEERFKKLMERVKYEWENFEV